MLSLLTALMNYAGWKSIQYPLTWYHVGFFYLLDFRPSSQKKTLYIKTSFRLGNSKLGDHHQKHPCLVPPLSEQNISFWNIVFETSTWVLVLDLWNYATSHPPHKGNHTMDYTMFTSATEAPFLTSEKSVTLQCKIKKDLLILGYFSVHSQNFIYFLKKITRTLSKARKL